MDEIYWGNTLRAYLIAGGAILAGFLILRLLRKVVLTSLKKITSKTDSRFDDLLISTIQRFVLPFLYFLIAFNVIFTLNLDPKLERWLRIFFTAVSIFFIVRLIVHVVHVTTNGFLKRRGETPSRIQQLNGLLNILKGFVWVLGFLFLLDNLGYNVTTIVTTLGVGGIAIALAAQVVLGDLFSYFAIFFDKPFEVGDFIAAGGYLGTIEHIGFKTTRIRSLSGEQLIMSNSELLKNTIQNYKRMERRRVVFDFGVKYNTEREKLNEIPGIIKDIISRDSSVLFDRAHLSNFTELSIKFEVVYIKLTPDFNKHMDSQQNFLITIFDEFGKRGIEFAHFPTKILGQA